MAAPSSTATATATNATSNNADNAPLAAAAAASNVWPNTRDSYELREVIGNLIFLSHNVVGGL